METQTATKDGFAIYHNFEIKASISKVFEAVSDPNHLVNWWPQKCSGTPKVDSEYNLFFTEEYNWLGNVIVCDKDKAFHIKMTKADPDWTPTSFGFDLEEIKNGVLVKFKHKNWPACNAHFRHSSFCWALLLNGLKNYVEKGIIIPFEERE